jgi:hypothetical protein
MTMHFIATSGAMSNGTTVHDFNSIPQNFQHLQVRLNLRDNASFVQRSWFLEINGNSPSGSNSFHWLWGDGASIGSGSSTGQGRWGEPAVPAASATSGVFGASILDILDYSNVNKTKTCKALNGYDNNGNGYVELSSYLYNSTNAITSLRFYTNQSFAAGSRIDLYGITSNPIATGA